MRKLKFILIVQGLLIVVLLSIIILMVLKAKNERTEGLLSPRVYQGILEPKSFLIVNYAPLRNDIESFIMKNNLSISVYVENLRSGAFFGIDERKGYPPASLNKVLISILIMKKVEDGELNLDSGIEITDKDRSSAFGDLYKSKETKIPLRTLMEKMLSESDDTAFKALNRLTDFEDKSLIMSYLDYYSDESIGNTKPGEDSDTGLVTPKSMYNVFTSLYLSTILAPEHSEYILSLLTNNVFDINEVANLPDNVTVAHKFATKYTSNDKFFHDCGISYIGERRVFYCIMTKDLDIKTATSLVGAIVHNIYYYTIDTKNKLEYYKDLYNYE